MILAGLAPAKSKIAVLGITFKENCPDIRNSKVEDIIKTLRNYNIRPVIADPWADRDEVKAVYGVEIEDINDITDADCVIIAVAHNEFKKMSISDFDRLFKKTDNKNKVLVDIKSIIDKKQAESAGYRYWRL